MRILFSDSHHYPFIWNEGAGRKITRMPSGSSKYIHDLMVKGLAEKGHEVFYLIKTFRGVAPRHGIKLVREFIDDVDIVHLNARFTPEVLAYYQSKNIPVLATNHLFLQNEIPPIKWVHVSKTLADWYGSDQFVWNGMNPEDFIFSNKKDDYFVFLANMSKHTEKGLDLALHLTRQHNIKLVVAGSSQTQSDIDKVQALCDKYQARYVGDIRGRGKARLISKAKALISPSTLPETFGLTLVEALFSGTPVICSDTGAYKEIMSKDVGFVCSSEYDYNEAIGAIGTISPEMCRKYAMSNFHYRETTQKYLPIYEEMLKTKLAGT